MQTNNFESVGRLASALRVPCCTVRRIAKQEAIEPSLVLNGVDHYSAADCERIAEFLKAQTDGVTQ